MTVQEAWKKILNITSSYEQGASSKLKDDPYYREEVNTIETALKDYKKQNDYYAKLIESVLNDKEHKALEIIKEKRVNVDTLFHTIHIFTESYALSQYNALYGNKIVINGVEQPNKALTQEEFDLLKEALK